MVDFNQNGSFVFPHMNISAWPSLIVDNASTSQTSPYIRKFSESEKLDIVERLTTHITLIVSIIGLIGNACTIIVLNQQSMRQWRSSRLLTSLAAVDFLYLFIIFLSIIDDLSQQGIGLNRILVLCQVTVYITHVCSFLSTSFTLSFTLQRFVAVLFPLHAKSIISNRSSTINILVLLVLGCSFYSFSFFLTNVSHGECREDETYPILFPLLIVDTCLTFIIPFIFILLFNCAIVYKLQQRKGFSATYGGSMTTANTVLDPKTSSLTRKTEANGQRESDPLNSSNDDHSKSLKPAHQSKRATSPRKVSWSLELTIKPNDNDNLLNLSQRTGSTTVLPNDAMSAMSNGNASRQAISQRTTKMLVICSTTFLLFNSPYCAVLLYCVIYKVVLTRTLGILRHFYFMSFCLNFFLYSLCGYRFRQEFILLLKSCVQKCVSKNTRLPWSRIEKSSNQSSSLRGQTRTAI